MLPNGGALCLRFPAWAAGMLGLCLLLTIGCGEERSPIVKYTIQRTPPDILTAKKRMLGAIVPGDSEVWFFKLVGDAPAVEKVVPEVRQWLSGVVFEKGKPVLALPADWINRGKSSMREATLEIPSEPLALELVVSTLERNSAWEQDYSTQIAMNVNRWRGQMGLAESTEPLAGGEVFETTVSTESTPAVWVDLVGNLSTAPMSMGAGPMGSMGPMSQASSAGGPLGPLPGSAKPIGGPDEGSATAGDRLVYDVPEGWREGKSGGMRMAAFVVGPEDRSAELTVIIAGGEVRPNVARWIGQVRPENVDEAVVDKVMADAVSMEVAGRQAQRFVIVGSGDAPQSIDATLVTLEPELHLFVKMTGDAQTVAEQSSNVETFLNSLQLNL